MSKVAIILSGCGFLDGSEIHESVLCFLALKQQGHDYDCFSIDKPMKKTVDHLTQEEVDGEKRNILVESARIARGKVKPLSKLDVKSYDALLMPGGFGAMCNLSDFDVNGENCSIDSFVKQKIIGFFKADKPILATCISPILIAKALQDEASVSLTLGSDQKYQEILNRMGAKGELKKSNEACFDDEHKIYTTPCYMEPDDLVGMYLGIKAIIAKL